jgi:hypothetical protein
LVALIFFLRVNVAKDPRAAVARIDWIGSIIFIGSVTAIMLGLVMGGNNYPWGTYHVIVPIVIGFMGWATFHVYEMLPICKNPSVPSRLFANRTALSGFFLTFNSMILLMWVVIFLPVYFQGVLGTSALTSGVNILPLSIFLVPSGIVAGGIMSKTGKYKPLHWAGFGIIAIGTGLLSTLNASSSKVAWAFFEIITAFGLGIVLTTLLPAIQSSLEEVDQAKITAIFSFMRSFGFVWGITIPALIFNNQFDSYLYRISDPQVAQTLSHGQAYSLVNDGFIQALAPSVRAEVVSVYVDSLKAVWEGAVAFALLGFVVVFAEKHYHLRDELETEYGLQDGHTKTKDIEKTGDSTDGTELKAGTNGINSENKEN